MTTIHYDGKVIDMPQGSVEQFLTEVKSLGYTWSGDTSTEIRVFPIPPLASMAKDEAQATFSFN